MSDNFLPRTLGKTGFTVGPLGVGSSYGICAKGTEESFERGVNYFYWGWSRRSGMKDGLKNINKNNREKVFITITSLAPTEPLIRNSVEKAMRSLNTDYIDGIHFYLMKNFKLFSSQIKPALKLKEEGKIRFIGASSHYRPNFIKYCKESFSDFLHIRYNAKHRGAEKEVFPDLPKKGDPDRPGTVAFTVTSWKQLLKVNPKKLGALPVPTAGDCYRFVLSHPDVDVCMTGPSNIGQMRENLDAIDKGPMTDDELEWMRKVGDILYNK